MKNFASANCKPKVAIVYQLDQPGGVQSVVLSLIKGLNSYGIIPDLLWDRPPNQAMLEEKGVKAGFCPIRLPVPSNVLDAVPTITARYLLRAANRIDVHQVPRAYDFYYIFYNGFMVNGSTPHVRYLSGPPLLPQLDMVSPGLRGMPYRMTRWAYKRYLRKRSPVYDYHRGSNYVINSHYTAQLFQQAHGEKLPVVHPPIDLSERSFTPDDLSQRDTVTFFSRFVDYKRPGLLLELADRYPKYRFVLMGGLPKSSQKYFEGLQRKAVEQGLANVNFFQNPSDQKVNEELARTRFFVFPGINEHFGMATAEAIGAGAIPFVHDSGGQREIVPDDRLRFQDSSFFEKFDRLQSLSADELNSIRMDLRDYVNRFSEEVFIRKMISFLDLSLESEHQNELSVTT